MQEADIGVIGLGVMGSNLALNIERNGFVVAGYDLDILRMESYLNGPAVGKKILGVKTPADLMAALETPRRILLIVPAGDPVDSAIAHLKPYLNPGDILIDGGNSFFMDTERRSKELEAEGVNFVGVGISGGEEGALWGPSLMPGGQRKAWEAVEPIFRAISARAEDREPCVAYIGPRGAGHYVKMVHNGIEYSAMQLIAEIYDLLSRGMGISVDELSDIIAEWNHGELNSYLIEITVKILKKKDPLTGGYLVNVILDEAQQKGTGKWTSQNALDIGAPIPTINAAVESRILSGLKTQRLSASQVLHGPRLEYRGSRQRLIDYTRQALYASIIISFCQGMGLLSIASEEYEYDLNLSDIAKIWRAGCIIRARLLEDIMAAYQRSPALVNLLLDESFRVAVESRQKALRFVIRSAVEMGIPVLALSASLAYFDAYRSARLPANLTQAQRDYFGAHTYRRVDREGIFHTEW